MERIATESELEDFEKLPDNQKKLTPAIKGVLAETALTGVIRYNWSLLRPVITYLMEQVLRDYEAESTLEVGPPRPLPNDETLARMIERFKGYLTEFRDAPWTLQRMCELLLEPHKQYTKLHKVALAIEKLLLVTSEEPACKQCPEPPSLSALGPVNENPPKVTAPVAPAANSRKRKWEGDEVGPEVGGLIITALNSTATEPWPSSASAAADGGPATEQAPSAPEATAAAAAVTEPTSHASGQPEPSPMVTDEPAASTSAEDEKGQEAVAGAETAAAGPETTAAQGSEVAAGGTHAATAAAGASEGSGGGNGVDEAAGGRGRGAPEAAVGASAAEQQQDSKEEQQEQGGEQQGERQQQSSEEVAAQQDEVQQDAKQS